MVTIIKNHVLTIHEDGSISTIWTDAIPLHALGEMSMKRASTIEWNEEKQVWEVEFTDAPGVVAFAHHLRGECISWEIAKLNEFAGIESGMACQIPERLTAAEHNAFPNGRWA